MDDALKKKSVSSGIKYVSGFLAGKGHPVVSPKRTRPILVTWSSVRGHENLVKGANT